MKLLTSNYKKEKASIFGDFCDPEAIRTPDPQLRRLLLYPTELPDLCSANQLTQMRISQKAFFCGCKGKQIMFYP